MARTPRAAVTSRTRGVRARHTVSLTKRAESTPETTTSPARSWRGERARRATATPAQRKNPASFRCATTTIIPKRRTIVPRSTMR
jgi:hypothetical protein